MLIVTATPPPLPHPPRHRWYDETKQDEAVAFAEKKLVALREELKRRVEEVANIQSHVKLVTEGIRELMLLAPDKTRITTTV